MSSRLNYAKKYDVQFGEESAFNYGFTAISDILNDMGCEICGGDDDMDGCEAGSWFEVKKSEISDMVNRLKNGTEREMYGLQVEDIIWFFSTALEKSDPNNDFIHFEWF